jgi:hypothetical protein
MTDIPVSNVLFGLPKLASKSAGAFSKARETVNAVAKAGPGHYAVASFDEQDSARIATFISGARYASKNKDGISVKRRKTSDGTVLIYVLNGESKVDDSF